MVKHRGRQRQPVHTPTGAALQRIARQLLPLYRAIACNRKYAAAWSRAVVSANLNVMIKLLCKVSPVLGRHGLGTNAIGYFISFAIHKSSYTNGVTIPPGTVRFKFETAAHRAVTWAILPLYRRLACQRSFADRLARAIRCHNKPLAIALIRSTIRSSALKAVHIDHTGFGLSFKFPFSKHVYQNLLFLEFEK